MLLQLKEVSIVDDNNTTILNNISFDIDYSTINCILGPNGAGKSTIAKSIIGYKGISNGSILFKGIDLSNLAIYQRAKLGIFFINQNIPSIDSLLVFTFLKEAYKALVDDSIDTETLYSKIEDAFKMVNIDMSFLSRYIGEFSGGEKKRFEIAQFILFKPLMAIFDEVDSGLDIDSIDILLNSIEYVKNCNKELSLLIISHSVNLLNKIDLNNIFFIKNGQLIKKERSFLNYIQSRGFSEL
jgi:Fe-S cluster assembly ATP-binding protein